MNRIKGYIYEINTIDDLCKMDSVMHRVHPVCKIVVTFIYIICVLSFKPGNIVGLVPMIMYPVIFFTLSNIRFAEFISRFKYCLGLLAVVGLFNPILDRSCAFVIGTFVVTNGLVTFVTLMIKEVLALSAVFILIATTGIEKLCYGLAVMKIPGMITGLLLLTYRYIDVLINEVHNMACAYKLRAPGQRGIRMDAWGSFLGSILIRSMDRAKEVYMSMIMRGYSGDFTYIRVDKVSAQDILFLIATSSVCVMVRMVNVAVYIGEFILSRGV